MILGSQDFLILVAIFGVAMLYSSVGHGGASGYLAVMALAGAAQAATRPSALLLNLFVAAIGTVQFWRRGYFSWRTFRPFAAASVPMAFVGGQIHLPTHIYAVVLGISLLAAAARLAWKPAETPETRDPSIPVALFIGAAIGLISGLVGVGGGIFLTPLLVLARWADTRTAAGVSALFILVNSAAGLAGNAAGVCSLPADVWLWIAAAVAGGVLGSTLGANKLDSMTLRRVLAVVLLFAGVKLIVV